MMNARNQQFSRRGLLGGAAGVAAMSALAGCGPESEAAPEQLGSEEEGKLVVWGGVGEERGPGALLDAFRAKYPKISVEYVHFVNNEQGKLKLDTALQGGVPIDVYFSYGGPELIRRTEAGLALDLTDLAAADERTKVFTGEEAISTRIDNRLFSLPTTHYPQFVLVNEDAIEKAGIDIPYDWTVEDYHDIARELGQQDGMTTGAYNMPQVAPTLLGGDYLYKEGGSESNFDHPAFREELERVVEMQNDNSIFTQAKITAEKIDSYPQNYFLNGSYGMFLNGTSSLRFVGNLEEYPHDFRTTFRPYPAPVAGKPYWNPGGRGDSVQISSKSQYIKAAWTFIMFWLDEGAPLIAPAGKVSPFASLQDDPPSDEMIAQIMGPERDRIYDVDSFIKVVFAKEPKLSIISITKGRDVIAGIKDKYQAEVRMGTMEIDEALTRMKEESDEAITKAG